MDVDFRCNTSGERDIHAHLIACSPQFSPPLESRVNLAEYATKLHEFATTFEAWSADRLVGLVACYENQDELKCFISNVSVVSEFRGKQIGRRLVEMCLASARQLSFVGASLEVSTHAIEARALYASLGFNVDAILGDTLNMSIQLHD